MVVKLYFTLWRINVAEHLWSIWKSRWGDQCGQRTRCSVMTLIPERSEHWVKQNIMFCITFIILGRGGTQSKDKVSENAAVRLAINLTWYKAVGTGLVYECVTSCLVLANLITYFGAIWERVLIHEVSSSCWVYNLSFLNSLRCPILCFVKYHAFSGRQNWTAGRPAW